MSIRASAKIGRLKNSSASSMALHGCIWFFQPVWCVFVKSDVCCCLVSPKGSVATLVVLPRDNVVHLSDGAVLPLG